MVEKIVSDLISSNVFVVSDGDFCFIVDAAAKVDDVKKKVAGRKVEAILITHGHYDHCARVEDYVKAFGAKVFASNEIEDYLKNGEYNYSEGKFFLSDLSNFEFFEGCEGVLKLPHFQIKYKQLGGHSKSDMMYDFNGDLFVGDVLIGRDMGRTDLYGGSREQMSKSLSALKEYDYVTMHSGHGEDFDKKTQDKVASLWLRYLNR